MPNERSKWARVEDEHVVEISHERPTAWTNPDGSTTSIAPDAIVDDAALRRGGWFPVDEQSPVDAASLDEGHHLEHERFFVERERVVEKLVVVDNATPDHPPQSGWQAADAATNERIDDLIALFDQVRERIDEGLHAIEQAAAQARLDAAVDMSRRIQAMLVDADAVLRRVET